MLQTKYTNQPDQTIIDDILEEHGLLRKNRVLKLLGIDRDRFYKEILKGNIPRPITFGDKMSLWNRSEIEQLIGKIVRRVEGRPRKGGVK